MGRLPGAVLAGADATKLGQLPVEGVRLQVATLRGHSKQRWLPAHLGGPIRHRGKDAVGLCGPDNGPYRERTQRKPVKA